MRDSLSSVEGGPAFAVSQELDNDLRSRRVSEPLHMEANEDWLHPGGLLPVSGHGNFVVSPSVFLHSGWALRHVSGAELGQMWDLPMKWKWLFGGYPDQTDLPFTCTAPAKVLWQYTARVDKFRITRGEAKRDPLELMPSFGIIPSEDLHLDNRFAKAVKNDEDNVPVYIWNNFVAKAVNIPLTPDVEQAFEQIRRGLLGRWQKLLYLSFVCYMLTEYGMAWLTDVSLEAARDCKVGRDCVTHASLASWRKWKDGLTLFF